VSGNALHVQCLFTGQCPSGASSLDQTIEMPAGFSAQVVFLNNPIQITLTQDSRSILFNNPEFPSCSEIATRNSALSTVTLNLVLVFLLSGLVSFKQSMM
jgi:hypothetical protein